MIDGNPFEGELTSSPYSLSLNTNTLTNGVHAISATARDAAGNTTTTLSVSVTVSNIILDTIPPTISLTSPANGQSVSGTIAVTANASDNVGVAGVQFFG